MKRKRHKTKKNHQFDVIWDEYFSKIYDLPPITDEEPFKIEEMHLYFKDLISLKDELNTIKSKLNTLDIVKWHQHTRSTHLCGNIVPLLSRHVNVELGSQAFAKFYTILNTFDIFASIKLNNVSTVHLCEAPGSFVTSLNHYIRSNYGNGITWMWYASTLNPYHEGNDTCQMIDDDRFIIETLPHWEFGPDFTGNIMTVENLNYFKEKFKNIPVLLVTADGSTDCSEKPDQQELSVSQLLLWETITALKILSEEGCFVLKIFTVFERFTLSLLYLLHTLFTSVTLIKPGPSKPGNSEVYVVCEGFSTINCSKSSIFNLFVDNAIKKNESEIDITNTIPKSFLLNVMKYVKISSNKQKKAISDNLSLFEDQSTLKESLKVTKDYFAKRFLKEFSIYPIQDFVSPLFVMKCKDGLIYNRSTALNFKRGSYNERIERSEKKDLEMSGTKEVESDVEGIENKKSDKNDLGKEEFKSTITSTLKRKEIIESEISYDKKEDLSEITFKCDLSSCYFTSLKTFQFIRGKKTAKIYSSSFMSSSLLKSYFEKQHQLYELKVNNSNIGYHYELEIIHQAYPDLEILQKESVLFISNQVQDTSKLVEYLSTKKLSIQGRQPIVNLYNTMESNDTNKDLRPELIIGDLGFIDANLKIKNITLILDIFSNLKLSSCIALRFDGLVLTSFWHGLFFLISSLFSTLVSVSTKVSQNSYYFVYNGFKGVQGDIDTLIDFLKRLHGELALLEDGVDIFHVVDIYALMQSNYRKYFIQRNKCFAQRFVATVSKLV